jgi:hypothetical protein
VLYDSTIFEYINSNKSGTASEGSVTQISENEPGVLNIFIQNNNYFEPRDTLIYLNFRTYLGRAPSTDIDFSEARFGDNNCSRIMNLTTKPGYFITDSVCNLDNKAVPYDAIPLSWNTNSEFITKPEIGVNFEIPYEAEVSLDIYDIYGNHAARLDATAYKKGIHRKNYRLKDISNGSYLLVFKFDKYYKFKTILLNK